MAQEKEKELKKAYLKGYEKTVRQMERSGRMMDEIRSSYICSSVINDGMPHAHNHSDLSSYAVLLEQEEKRYDRYKDKCAKKRNELIDEIGKLGNEEEKYVLTCRYVWLMRWHDICAAMGYSLQHVYRIHARALGNLKMRVNESK